MGKRLRIAALIAIVAPVVGYRAALKPWMYRCGSNDDEVAAALPGDWTRLLVRGSGNAFGKPVFGMVQFLMEQKTMRGIRDRAHQARRRRVNERIARSVEPDLARS